jgi:hypothetical protein
MNNLQNVEYFSPHSSSQQLNRVGADSQYQQGSIGKVRKAKGYAWEVRFSEWLNGKRYQRSMTFQSTEYPKEAEGGNSI